MSKYIIYLSTALLLAVFIFLVTFSGCSKKDDTTSKNNLQYIADKEKELNDREAQIRLKEAELEEREKKLNGIENVSTSKDTSKITQKTDTGKTSGKKDDKTTQEIQKDITKKFENPATTVKDYYEYIQRAINETGNFDSNMKKAHEYFPNRSPEKMKASYRNTKVFTVLEEPKVLSQKDDKATVTTKVKQVEVVKKDGNDSEVTKTMTVTYDLQANKEGQWLITGNSVKAD